VAKIRDGARGIDCYRQLIPPTIAELVRDGFVFALRYLSRSGHINPSDIRTIEAETLRRMGMAIGFVQHCPPGLWTPNRIIAQADALSAVRQLKAIGTPSGVTVWFDLESVNVDTEPSRIAEHVNSWSTVIDDGGFQSGLYVGSGCILSPHELWQLRVTRYWSAYNLNIDQYPAERGVCMHQHSGQAVRPWCDIDVVSLDALSGLPTFWESE
jgi:hypothetical protein